MSRQRHPLLLLPALVACNNPTTEVASPEPAPTHSATAVPNAVTMPGMTATTVAPVSSGASSADPIALKRAALAIKGMR